MSDIEMSLREIAARARRDRLDPSVYKAARKLTDDQPTISAKVKAIVDRVRLGFGDVEQGRMLDADEAVLAAATMCLSVGIRCRVVGARYNQGWTCWLAYLDDGHAGRVGLAVTDPQLVGQWVTVDVLEGDEPGELVGQRREPDEQVSVECQPEKWATEYTITIHNIPELKKKTVREREYREIMADDVGKSVFFAFGRHWPVSDFIGRIFDVDVGKRVYRAGEHVVSVENAAQFEARREAEVRNCSCSHGSMGGPCSLCGHHHPIGTVCSACRQEASNSNTDRLAKLVYAALTAKLTSVGLGIDLVRPPNPAQGNAVAVLFADGRDVVIRFEESGGR